MSNTAAETTYIRIDDLDRADTLLSNLTAQIMILQAATSTGEDIAAHVIEAYSAGMLDAIKELTTVYKRITTPERGGSE
ncbi:MAG: hypothetical protein IKO47_14060 [Ruminococcus sp.]|nr:hypothetical protein [Ruminococcus sp.]MBR4628787.1 hypothetical protein [Ruminococcus sp.]